MFRVAATLVLILASTTTLGSRSPVTYQDPLRQVPEYPCGEPPFVLRVECPDSYTPNSDLVFHAYTDYPRDEYEIKFRWTIWWARGVRKGRIKSGQGSDTLVVSARHGKVTGIVRITGTPKECMHTASCTTLTTLK